HPHGAPDAAVGAAAARDVPRARRLRVPGSRVALQRIAGRSPSRSAAAARAGRAPTAAAVGQGGPPAGRAGQRRPNLSRRARGRDGRSLRFRSHQNSGFVRAGTADHMDALVIQELRKRYPTGVQALKGIDLTVREGDFFALLGPNGAGKTTAIGIITSLVTKTSGRVIVFGRDLDREREAAKSLIGVVPQEVNLNMFERNYNTLVNQAG